MTAASVCAASTALISPVTSCAITADGPRGPSMVAKPGVIQLAKLVDSTVVAFYAHPERAWQLRSWDRFLIPKPFSRGDRRMVAPDPS